MSKTTWTLGLALAFGVLGGPALFVGTAAAGPDTDGQAAVKEEMAAWDKKLDKTLNDKVPKEYEKLWKWCTKSNLAWTGNFVRRGTFRFSPDHKKTREYFGYEKRDGKWVQDEEKKLEFRTQYFDEDDPQSSKMMKNIKTLKERVGGWFAAMAKKAARLAGDKSTKPFPALQDEWRERAKVAWNWAILAYPEGSKKAVPGHKYLKHPKYGGKYVTPFKLKFLEVRDSRKKIGEKIEASPAKSQKIDLDGILAQAALSGGGAQSEHFTVFATHGADGALRSTQYLERSIQYSMDIHHFPEQIVERLVLRKLHLVKERHELRKVLEASGWDNRRIERNFKAGFGGMSIGNGERVGTVSPGRDLDDHSLNVGMLICTHAARALAVQDVGNPNNDVEDWLWQTMGYDATMRVCGTHLTVWGAFGKYGNDVNLRPGQDKWLYLARRQVLLDDDVEMKNLFRYTLPDQQFKGREIVKGYAFYQFLYESDESKARKFTWHAVAQGTPAALMAVYGEDYLDSDEIPEDMSGLPGSGDRTSLPKVYVKLFDKIEEDYREWILGAF